MSLWPLAVYCLFILYGSFIPFNFVWDVDMARTSLAAVRLVPFAEGQRRFSLLDVISNIGLYMPFGMLIAAQLRHRVGRSPLVGTAAAGAAGLAIVIETGQLFLPGRIVSPLDVAANAVGAVIGCILALLVIAPTGDPGRALRQLLRREPLLLPIGILGSALALDRWYPFHVTLDVSTAWTNLKGGQWAPMASFGTQHWLDLLVTKLVWVALLAAMVQHALARPSRSSHPRLAGGLIVTTIVVLLEAGKLGFVGRRPGIDAVLLGGLGALAGVTVVTAIIHAWPIARWPAAALAGLALALLTQAELTPFDFALSPAAIWAKGARIEWLPLSSYYGADPQVALHDLFMKLLHGGFLGFAVANLRGRSSAIAAGASGLVAGLLLEMAQLATAARHPGVTDVLIVSVGAIAGGRAYARFRGHVRAGARCGAH